MEPIKPEPNPPDLVLSDGREIRIDLNKITIREFRALLQSGQADAEEYATIGKAVGMSADEVAELSYPDYKRLTRAWFDKARKPLDDPNP